MENDIIIFFLIFFCFISFYFVISFCFFYEYIFSRNSFTIRKQLKKAIENGYVKPVDFDTEFEAKLWKTKFIWHDEKNISSRIIRIDSNDKPTVFFNHGCLLSGFEGDYFAKRTNKQIINLLHNLILLNNSMPHKRIVLSEKTKI